MYHLANTVTEWGAPLVSTNGDANYSTTIYPRIPRSELQYCRCDKLGSCGLETLTYSIPLGVKRRDAKLREGALGGLGLHFRRYVQRGAAGIGTMPSGQGKTGGGPAITPEKQVLPLAAN